MSGNRNSAWPCACATNVGHRRHRPIFDVNQLRKVLGAIAVDRDNEGHRLTDEADLIGRASVVELFDKEKDPITLIKLKEVYEFFEGTIDSCEDVADVLQNVVVKNS